MTLYDANDIKTLVQNQWGLNTIYPLPAYNIVNGDFETGNISPWIITGAVIIQSSVVHSGTYDAELQASIGSITYVFPVPIAQSTFPSFSFWYLSNFGSLTVTLTFSDNPDTSAGTNVVGIWAQANVLTMVTNPCTGDLLFPVGKHCTSITVSNSGGNDYVDDFQPIDFGNLYLQLDEYTPVQPDYQIVFINTPERVMFVAPNVIKHEMDVTLQVYQKLPHYQNDDIETTYRPRQLAMKNELTRIMNTYRFNTIAQGVTINHSSWRDSKFPHGLGSEAEPISFLSTMSVQIHWYEAVSEEVLHDSYRY